MDAEHDYVNFFYNKFEGRVAIGVGYDQNLSEIYPFVFEDTDGKSIGIVALGVYPHENVNHVHVYHIGSFKSNRGNGSQILQQLCDQADKYQVILSLSPIFMPNGKHEPISTEQLRSWYGQFGFRGSSPFKREPTKI
jgi:N-acetylglutamate synthase-like GNAT family acetyltransferase